METHEEEDHVIARIAATSGITVEVYREPDSGTLFVAICEFGHQRMFFDEDDALPLARALIDADMVDWTSR